MRDSTVLRVATSGDLDVLVEFNTAMALETEHKVLERAVLELGVKALLDRDDRGRYYVLELDGVVVAALMLTTEWSDWRNGYFWWIQSVYVRPADRRRGYYRQLYDHVHTLAARDPLVCGLRLYVEQDNQTARKTYSALGMEETPYRLYETRTRS